MRKALIVGINDYPDKPLEFCVNDSTSFANILETNGDGSPNFSTKLVNNIKTKSEFKGLVKELFEGDVDIALLYFSGHGYVDEVGGYLVTPDYQENDVGISMYDILVLANASKAKNKIIILDCCSSGKFGSANLIDGTKAIINEGITVLTASRGDQLSFEINGHGIFTALILNALQGGAADLRGCITPGSIYAYIDQALGPWEQRPIFKTNISQFVSLRTVPPPVSIEKLRKIIEFFPAAEDELKLDPSFEFTSDTKEDNNVAIFKDLQKFESVGLVVPVGEEHMYFAAMNSKSCKLTALGFHYWRLVKNKRI